MSAVPAAVVERWQKTVTQHPRRWCPKCKQRRCWEQAEARGQLIAHGLPLPPPPNTDRPHQTAGTARERTA